MVSPEDHPVERAGKRLFGSVIGLVLGVVVGVIVALVVFGFGDAALAVIGVCLVGGAVVGFFYPSPFLFVGELLIGIFSDAA